MLGLMPRLQRFPPLVTHNDAPLGPQRSCRGPGGRPRATEGQTCHTLMRLTHTAKASLAGTNFSKWMFAGNRPSFATC
jgi:hypothetical protein